MTRIKLKIIGCGDAFGSKGNLNTCFYLQAGQINLLIDCGASSLPGLKKQQIDPDDIDWIIISHFHGDHYGGIPFILMDAAARKRQRKLTILTPKTGKARIMALLELLSPGLSAIDHLPLEFVEYQPGKELQTRDFNLKAFAVKHSEAALSHGLRLSINDKTISYSGDTSWTETLVSLSKNADLFICECNFYRTKVKGHMNYLDLSTKLPRLEHRRILLTHLGEEMLQELDHINLPYAKDGMDLII